MPKQEIEVTEYHPYFEVRKTFVFRGKYFIEEVKQEMLLPLYLMN